MASTNKNSMDISRKKWSTMDIPTPRYLARWKARQKWKTTCQAKNEPSYCMALQEQAKHQLLSTSQSTQSIHTLSLSQQTIWSECLTTKKSNTLAEYLRMLTRLQTLVLSSTAWRELSTIMKLEEDSPTQLSKLYWYFWKKYLRIKVPSCLSLPLRQIMMG